MELLCYSYEADDPSCSCHGTIIVSKCFYVLVEYGSGGGSTGDSGGSTGEVHLEEVVAAEVVLQLITLLGI